MRRRLGAAAGAALAGLVGYDLAQRRRAILRNFPVAGHFRYLLESFGPELRHPPGWPARGAALDEPAPAGG